MTALDRFFAKSWVRILLLIALSACGSGAYYVVASGQWNSDGIVIFSGSVVWMAYMARWYYKRIKAKSVVSRDSASRSASQ
jgi:hypothetical protein